MKDKLNIFENIYFYFESIHISCNVLNTEILIVMLFSIILVVIFYNN